MNSLFLAIATLFASPADSSLLGRLATAYDYAGIRGVQVESSIGRFHFKPGKAFNLEVASSYDLFPSDSARYWFNDSQFTRKVLPGAKTDVGKVPGVVDFGRQFRKGGARVISDSSRPDVALIHLEDIHDAWFALGHVPVIPFVQVPAELTVDKKTLEIRELRAHVHTPGGMPPLETYVLKFGDYRSIQGRLIPGTIHYSIDGLLKRMNDPAMQAVQATSMRNKAYKDTIQAKIERFRSQGQYVKAEKYKRAAVRVRSLKVQIADASVNGSGSFDVRLLRIKESGKSSNSREKQKK